MKHLNNFIKDQEVRPLTTWQCNKLCGGAWPNDPGKKKKERQIKAEMKEKQEELDLETLLIAKFESEDRSKLDPPGQCPHM